MLPFNKRFKILRKIGNGSFGDVHKGLDVTTNETVAIKIETRSLKTSRLKCEYELYNLLCDGDSHVRKGIPEIYYFGNFQNKNVMVMERLGPSLESLFNRAEREFSLQTVLLIGMQLLELFQFIHKRRIIHRDIKPDNFLIGVGDKQNTIYMIDFGLSKEFKRGRKHIHYSEERSLTGTLRYASVRNHIGIEQSRRDDLESLGYMLVYFMKGKLPWQGLKGKDKREQRSKIKFTKISTRLSELCSGLPEEFYTYLCYCRNLEFSETPNYTYLRGLFKGLYSRKFGRGEHYDWLDERFN